MKKKNAHFIVRFPVDFSSFFFLLCFLFGVLSHQRHAVACRRATFTGEPDQRAGRETNDGQGRTQVEEMSTESDQKSCMQWQSTSAVLTVEFFVLILGSFLAFPLPIASIAARLFVFLRFVLCSDMWFVVESRGCSSSLYLADKSPRGVCRQVRVYVYHFSSREPSRPRGRLLCMNKTNGSRPRPR